MDVCRYLSSSSPELFFDTPKRGDFPDPIPIHDPATGDRPNKASSTPVLRNFSYPSHVAERTTPVSRQPSVKRSRTPPIPRVLKPLTPVPTHSVKSHTFVRSLRCKNRAASCSDKGLFDQHFITSQSGCFEDQDGPPRKNRRSVLSVLSTVLAHNRLFARRASIASTTNRRRDISPENGVRKKKSLSDLVSFAAFPNRKRHPICEKHTQASLVSPFQAPTASRVNVNRPASSSGAQPSRSFVTSGGHRRAQSASIPIDEIAKLDISLSMSPPSNDSPSKSSKACSGALVPVTSQKGSLGSFSGPDSGNNAGAKAKGMERKTKWLSGLKGWITTSEPSTQALKQHRQDTFKKAGVALSDPQAHARLHAPIGTIPGDAIKPAGPGPDPEKVAWKRAQGKKKGDSYGGLWAGGSVSQSSSTSNRSGSASSLKFISYPGEK
ncbi:hypothetical protein MKZ38_008598 [Zalerion maritima]|uniref:Uncharacterized protein n=1 Tax=Zalerion maritima TaxID=339359 RepID=A0AAD5S028_9PEZI|nr:hypothetical protein MKZ38_008598 [Zalerion maritima]